VSTAPPAGGDLPPTRHYRETNGLAIGSLILGIIAIVPVSIVLGIIALVQIPRRGDKGKGLAIAGIAISCAWVVILVVGILVFVNNIAERDAAGNITDAGLIDELDLRPGDCLNGADEDDLLFKAVPCDEPHEDEVYGRFTLSGDGYPGGESIRRRATAGCRHRLEEALSNDGTAGFETTYFSPDRVDWAVDDHDVTCLAHYPQKRTGSLSGV
jgi:hypothetical protein